MVGMDMAEKAGQRRLVIWLLPEIINSYLGEFCETRLVGVPTIKEQENSPAMMPLNVDID
jgi:hypothetical protein